MHVTIHTAKTHLSKLIDAALAGEDVIISKGATPVVRVVALAKGGFILGPLKNQLGPQVPDFLSPLDPQELDLWEGQDHTDDKA
jgi:prevent-host-death family protein